MTEYTVPGWYEIFRSHYVSEDFHQFLFDGNIYDSFFWPSGEVWKANGKEGRLYTFSEFMIRSLLLRHRMVLYYSSTGGISLYRPGNKVSLPLEMGEKKDIPEKTEDILMNIRTDVKKFEKAGIPTNRSGINDRVVENLLRIENFLLTDWMFKDENNKKQPASVAAIIDCTDKILSDSQRDSTTQHLAERIQGWGFNRGSQSLENLSILITENRDLLPAAFRSDHAGTLPIRIPIPDPAYRKLFFQSVAEDAGGAGPLHQFLQEENAVAAAAQLTRGFRVLDCDELRKISNRAGTDERTMKCFFPDHSDGPSAFRGFLERTRKEVIESSSRGMLDPLESTIDFEDIGGLGKVIDYFKKVCKAIREKDQNPKLKEIIPKGVLLAGPPGTGKTLLAKALAKSSGISLVRMGDIRSMWVGESERNLTMVLELLKAMAPVIVFVDEIDQAIGSRSSTSGDSGVGGRMFGKILEFMGDNDNRGEVIWIAATNRADLLDDAMVRRFDRVIPVLLPGSKVEWTAVIRGICKQMNVAVENGDTTIHEFVAANLEKLRENHSGSSIEMVLRYAYQTSLADEKGTITQQQIQYAFHNFKTNFDRTVYAIQTLLSIAACNEIGFITEPSNEYSYGDLNDTIKKALDAGSNRPIDEKLQELRRMQSLGR